MPWKIGSFPKLQSLSPTVILISFEVAGGAKTMVMKTNTIATMAIVEIVYSKVREFIISLTPILNTISKNYYIPFARALNEL